jgi:molybdopterin converting factor small subunit
MVEIRYGEYYEVADLAGQTISEAREQFRAEFGIPDNARAKLNGSKVKGSAELDTVLNDDDKVSFAVSKAKGAYLVGALLLALAATGGVFAFGWINASTTINVMAASSDFAKVTENGSDPLSFQPYGFFKGATGNGTLFDIDTMTSGYTGDLVVTVSIANGDELAKCYRVLALRLYMARGDGTVIDINESGGAGDISEDYALLTLGNGEVNLFPQGSANFSYVKVKNGFYITHIWKQANWTESYEDPILFCEVAQR